MPERLSQQEGNAGAGGHGSCPWGAPGNHTQCAASCLPTGPLLGGLAHVYYRSNIINKGWVLWVSHSKNKELERRVKIEKIHPWWREIILKSQKPHHQDKYYFNTVFKKPKWIPKKRTKYQKFKVQCVLNHTEAWDIGKMRAPLNMFLYNFFND